jgi:hypothetical protein
LVLLSVLPPLPSHEVQSVAEAVLLVVEATTRKGILIIGGCSLVLGRV